MNFLGVGPLEVALVAIVAVIVLGPERTLGVAVELGRAVRYMRSRRGDSLGISSIFHLGGGLRSTGRLGWTSSPS